MRHRLLTYAAIAIVAVAAPSAFAAKGGNGGGNGNGHGGGGGSGSSAWVTASPNPVAAGGERVYLTGCGYAFEAVAVKVHHSAGYTEEFWVGMWSTGCMDSAYFLSREAGTYTIEVYQSNSPRLALMATTTLDVG